MPFPGVHEIFHSHRQLQRHMRRTHNAEADFDVSEAVIGPEAKKTNPAELCQDSVGSKDTSWPTLQSREHEGRLNRPCSPLQTQDTIWTGESGFTGAVEPWSMELSQDFEYDNKAWFSNTLKYFARQDLTTPFQGDLDKTYEQFDTTRKLGHCQSNHAPPGPVDASHVQFDALQAPNLRKQGTVIPCPLKQQNGCSGKDENMASLERKLKSKCHGIYYHNQCKTLLSAPSLNPSNDMELFCKSHEESERHWSSHVKECHGKFCVLTECAPDPLGDLRHERTGKCKKTRGDVKQAEFNYLCHSLGVSQQNIEVGIKHDHQGQRKAPRTAKASAPIVKIEQDVPKVESIDTSSDDDNTRLTREVDSLKHSIQVLERDRERHISIMRHLVYDMLQNHVELTDVVRERLHRHAPSVLPKHSWETSQNKPITHHVHNYPYTPSPSSATPTVVKRKRDGSLNVSRTRSPPNTLTQDLPRSDHDFLLSPEKRQKTGLAAQDEKLPSTATDSQFTSPRSTPMSKTGLVPHWDRPAREQATLRPNHDQSLSAHQHTSEPLPINAINAEMSFTSTKDTKAPAMSRENERIRQRPAFEFVRPWEFEPLPLPPIGSMSENPTYQFHEDILNFAADVATRQGDDGMLDIGPQLEWQQSTEHYTGFADNSFNTSLCDDWPSYESRFLS